MDDHSATDAEDAGSSRRPAPFPSLSGPRTRARDDPAAKQTPAGRMRDGGLVPVDGGPLCSPVQFEGLGYLGIMIQQPLALHVPSAWKPLR